MHARMKVRVGFLAAAGLFLAGMASPPAMADSEALKSEIAQVCGAVFTVSQTATGPLTEGVCANGTQRVFLQDLPAGLSLELEGDAAGDDIARRLAALAIRTMLPENKWALALFYIETRRARALFPFPAEQRFGDYSVTIFALENGLVRTRLAPYEYRPTGGKY